MIGVRQFVEAYHHFVATVQCHYWTILPITIHDTCQRFDARCINLVASLCGEYGEEQK